MKRRYAETTKVPVSKSRGEIDALLRAWGCSGIGWIDNFQTGQVELHFRWSHEGVVYNAKFVLPLLDDDALRELAVDGRNGRFSPAKFEQEKRDRGKVEHRILMLWIKAALNAVEAGIVDPAAIFLPWLVGRDGKTFSEAALPRLPELLVRSASRLLASGVSSGVGEAE